MAFLSLISEIGSDLYAISGMVKEKLEKEDLKDTEKSSEDQQEDTESENKESEKEEKIISYDANLQMPYLVENGNESLIWKTNSLLAKCITSVIYSPPERLL